jgi:hypothetical protein
MLVNAVTGADMREAQDFEVEHIRSTANFSGVSSLGPQAVTMRVLGLISADRLGGRAESRGGELMVLATVKGPDVGHQ